MKEMDGFFTLVITSARRNVGGPGRLRLQAGGRRRDSGLRGRGIGVPGTGRAARHRRRPTCSNPCPRRSTRGVAERHETSTPSCELDCDDARHPGGQPRPPRVPDGARPGCMRPRGRHNSGGRPDQATCDRPIEGNAGYFLGGLSGDQGRGRARDRGQRVRGLVGRREPDGWHHPRARRARRRAQVRVPGVGASSSRATRRCGPASRSRAAPWPSPATPAP